jgi:type VI secretion system protein ImpM
MAKSIAVFGKHPSFGDFVAQGLPRDMRDHWQTWLTGALSEVKAQAAEGWPQVYDTARPIGFWLGPAVLGLCVRGVLCPSRDSVGRRYPLIGLMRDEAGLPPPLAPDQSAYIEMETHLSQILTAPLESTAELGSGDGLTGQEQSDPVALWAVNPDAGPADLLQAVGSADYTRAAASRSYWWCAPDDIRSGAVWSCEGLAGADALLWLMSGVARAAPVGEDENEAGRTQTMTGDNAT